MRTFRICWILCVPLLGILGCTNSNHKGEPITVTITNCKADPEMVEVYRGDDLTWKIAPSDNQKYSISFKGHTPVSSSTFPAGQSHKVTGDPWCNVLGRFRDDYCRYRYDLVPDGSKTCADPGVHIVP